MKNKISPPQAVFFIIQSQIGVGILALPHLLMKDMGHDGWMAIILACFFIQIINTIFLYIIQKYPETSFFQALIEVFGKWIGRTLVALYTVYFASVCIVVLAIFTRTLGIWVLPLTPNWIINLLMMISIIYIAKEKIAAIVRYNFILTPFLLMLSLLMFYSLKGTNIDYLMPFFQTNLSQVSLGLKDVVLSMNGFEMILIISPFMKGGIKVRYKVMTISNICTTLYYLFITLICFMFFSPIELNVIPSPVLYLLKTISFGVIERTDLIFLSFWVFVILATLSNYLYFCANGVSSLFKKKEHKKFVYYFAILIYAVSCFLANDNFRIQRFNEFTTIAQYSFIYTLPIFMAIIIFIKHRKGKVKSHAS
ncbi:endospore germination permease [Bacillus sp. FSL L8-0167]|uniref:Spore germination protein YndE n=1 Tax=Bacillus safensis TaxID=561879 RepID=A0A5C0WIB4_BACIA|nr:endospore germination permease [Bacillus safensis]MBY0191418.1 endospore germination permease [Bacillus aerophilus]KKD41229.1 spore gernimation protein [Bacillus safensis]MCM3450208.1 spore germination protein [Bacillus safensis]MDR6682249.1 spore germination protein (amino acid permease) [Bacillus safensis]MEC0948190.1 endospore germination permease [Bacillus safensis]